MVASPAPRRPGVWVVWWVLFLDLLGFGMVLPSLAYFVHVFEVPPGAVEVGRRLGITEVSAVFVGLIQTSYSFFQFFCAPLWGQISDRRGRRPVLVATMAGFTLAWLLFALAPSLGWLLFARALAGVFGANIATAQAYMADSFPGAERARGMGLIGMALGVGFVFGPALGALLSSDLVVGLFFTPGTPEFVRGHLLVPGLVASGLSGTAFLVALGRLPESLPAEARQRAELERPRPLRTLVAAFRAPGVGPMLFIYFLITLGFASLEAMFSPFNLHHLRLGHSANGWVFTAIGLTMAVVQGGLIGRVTARLGGGRTLIAGLVSLTLAMAAFGFQVPLNPGLPPLAWSVLMAVWVGASYSVCHPSLLALMSKAAAGHAQGGTMGLGASSATLGRVVGPALGGMIYSAAGPEWPFVGGGLFLVLALLVLLRTEPA